MSFHFMDELKVEREEQFLREWERELAAAGAKKPGQRPHAAPEPVVTDDAALLRLARLRGRAELRSQIDRVAPQLTLQQF